MSAQAQLKHGDFTQLATMYSSYRPGYSETVLDAILGITKKNIADIDFADVGAGTGIWTRMVAERGCHSVTAVEPNDAMRNMGASNIYNKKIKWQPGTGENTGLNDNHYDLVSMASSFHWVDFEKGIAEFHRILKKGGHFVALWNPRVIETNPLLVDIENHITSLCPNIKRVSSGRSPFVNELSMKLEQTNLFSDLIYLEGKHTAQLSQEHYLGVWESVNDIRFQLGEEKFSSFMNYVRDKIDGLDHIDCTYQTRAWIVRK